LCGEQVVNKRFLRSDFRGRQTKFHEKYYAAVGSHRGW
jgi:hypothetical protein